MEDSKSAEELNTRIAIVGAGAAGLTAAEALRQKGYAHVTIFEKSDRVGGKCLTTKIDGRPYELGAGIVSGNNKTVLGLVQRFNVPMKTVTFGKSLIADAETGSIHASRTLTETMKLFKELLLTYRNVQKRFSKIARPGLAHLHKDLALPFSDFAKKYKIERVGEVLANYFTGYGYGYFNDAPAAYVLKYYCWDTVKAFIKHQIYFFPQGIQHLWTAVAKNLDVRYNAKIKQIKRGDEVIITTEDETMRFDRLILASPLDEAIKFIDADKTENDLFSSIQTVDYRTIACSVTGLEKVGGYIPGNYTSTKKGHPVFWHFWHKDSNVYTFYTLADKSISDELAVQYTKEFIEKAGGSLEKVHIVKHWKYFPHVSAERFRNGFFDDVEALQGKRNTYYVGEVMNFSTVGFTAQYAQDLVERFF
jgi:predicted NAD/FAD-dependent oxidoreductase